MMAPPPAAARDRRNGALLLLAIAAALLAATAGLFWLTRGPAPSGLPTWQREPDSIGEPLGATGGVLSQEGPCLYIGSAPEAPLAIWPAGYTLRDGVVRDGSGKAVATVGRTVSVSGAEMPSPPRLATGVDPSCRRTLFWLVTGIMPRDAP